jgi:hypothetical protein
VVKAAHHFFITICAASGSGGMEVKMKEVNGVTLNTLEVLLSKPEITIYKINYDKEQFDKYKKNYKDYFFYKLDKYIYVWQKRNTLEELSNEFDGTSITFKDDILIFVKAIETSLVEYFKSRKYEVYKKKYSNIWEVVLRREKPEKFIDLDLIPVLSFSVQPLFSSLEKSQLIALSIKHRHKPRFITNEETLKNKNIDTRGWDRNFQGDIVSSYKNVYKYLNSTNQVNKFKNFNKKVQADNYLFEKLQSATDIFNKIKDNLYLPDNLKVENFLLTNVPNSKFELLNVPKPKYYFHYERTGTGFYHEQVKALKPVSYDVFENKQIKILGITPSIYLGSTENFLKKLKDSLETTFYLNKLEIDIQEVDNNPQGYVDKLNELDIQNYDLALIVLSEKDKNYSIKQSPYYLTKSKLLNQKVPSQKILIERIRGMNPYILNNISLNIYSKIGGTAWTIEKNDKLRTELIIGIGSSIDFNSNRVMGFANVFDYNGTYIVGDCSQLSSSENYAINLEKHLRNLIKRVIEDKCIEKGEKIRLIFHLYKSAGRNNEIKAIENVLLFFEDYQIDYCILHLSYNHNYRLYKDSGNSQVYRGSYIQLSTYQALLSLGGKSNNPILIRLDKRSTYKDIYFATKQLLSFIHLSYRNFKPSSEPVTVKYPKLMAKLASELRQIEQWDPNIMNFMNEKLWFL